MLKTLPAAGSLIALLALAACGDKPSPAPAASASAPAAAVNVQSTALGAILTDQTGRTLYAFLPDKEGPGSCKEDCEATWPPFLAPQKPAVGPGTDAALLTLLPRDGGVSQVKYGAWPLYSYVADLGPGDVEGQAEEDGNWWVVGADGKLIKTSAQPAK